MVQRAIGYAQQVMKNGWSRPVMEMQIETGLYERQGITTNKTTNYHEHLPSAQSDLARDILKDPYNFDFLTITDEAHERDGAMHWLIQPVSISRRCVMADFCNQAPLRTTPYRKTCCQKYDIDYIRRKAQNFWDKIWDDLGIPMFYREGTCPFCKHNKTFQVTDISTGIFYCSQCKIRGDGVLLLQRYHQWDIDETIERLGRNLKKLRCSI